MFKRQKGYLSKEFLDDLLKAEPEEPVHDPPPSIESKGFTSLIPDYDRRMFSDFDDFAEFVNRIYRPSGSWKGGAWRLQERNSPLVHDGGDLPTFGRCYWINYNRARIGTAEFCTYEFSAFSPDPKREEKLDNMEVVSLIEIEHARVLPFHEVRGFIDHIASLTATEEDGSVSGQVNREIDLAMMSAIWNSHSDDLNSIILRIKGFARNYLKAREHRR